MRVQRIESKSKKNQVLLKNPHLRKYIPASRKMTKKTLLNMLRQYRMVYVKPDRGSQGKGVIRVEKKTVKASSKYQYQEGLRPRSFSTYSGMYGSLRKTTGYGKHVVQKGIRLLNHRGRKFDIRVMVQRNPSKAWEVTGILARVAAPQKIVTNWHSGGKPMPLSPILKPYIPHPAKRKRYIRQLKQLALRSARHSSVYYPRLAEVGVDLALDKKLKPWILEVNTNPDPLIFAELQNKAMFRKVLRFRNARKKWLK